MRKRSIFVFKCFLIIMVAFLLFFSSCAKAATKWQLKHATYATAEHPYTKVAQGFADKIYEATNGQVEIKIYPNASLCAGSDQFTATAMGVADVTDLLSDYLVGQVDMIGLGSVPLSFDSRKAGEVGEAARDILTERLAKENLIYLYTYDYLPNVLFLQEKKESLSKMQGTKVRGSGIFPIEMLKAVGMVPVKMSTSDIYMSVETGLIRGAMTGILSWRSNRLNEVLPYIYSTPIPCIGFVVMNKDTFDSFPVEIKEIVINVSKQYSVVANKIMRRAEAETFKEATEELGCTLIEWSDKDRETWIKEAKKD
jgi:TRAP-type C4-dicarboxylate transport system substrate-binding protein